MKLKFCPKFVTILTMLFTCGSVFSQGTLKTAQQIQRLVAEKRSRTPVERKISSQLLQAMREANGRQMTEGVRLKPVNVGADSAGGLQVDINAAITPSLLGKLKVLGGKIIYSSARFHSVRVKANLAMVQTIAGWPEVRFVKPASKAHLVGSGNPGAMAINPGAIVNYGGGIAPAGLKRPSFKERAERVKKQLQKYMVMMGIGLKTSEGDHTMGADSARKTFGYQGQGIRIGVLSDSYDSQGSYGETPNASTNVASGDLPGVGNPLGNTTPVTVVQDYVGYLATDEGRAMLQIVHDIAPKAQLFFATAYLTDAQFADNILALRAAPNNCDIIIDDVIYYDEPAYQDGIIAQAVNTVTASGAMYFSSAGNGGSVLMNYASVYEGDFNDAGSPLFTSDTAKTGGSIHNFGTVDTPEIGNTIFQTLSTVFTLKWADPQGGSTNDYDLFIVDRSGDVEYSSTDIQDGTQDPYEEIDLTKYVNTNTGAQILVFKDSSAKPVTFVINANTDGFGPALKHTTPGLTYGHSSAANAFSVAATPALAAYPGVFTASDQVEYFSSDGPRHIFFNADGTPITPGNFTIATNGGTVRRKPDVTAADGVSTTTFNPFYGTSAAAPHAGAIAALLKSANPALTPGQIRTLLINTALDIEAPGYDNNSGYGIVQAFNAMLALNPKPLPAVTLGNVTVTEGAFSNHNGSYDPGESGTMTVQLLNQSLANATGVHAMLTTTTPGVTIIQDSAWYGSILKGGNATNTIPFAFAISPTVPCDSKIVFYVVASPDSAGTNTEAYQYTITTGHTVSINISSTIGVAPPVGIGYTAVSGQQTGTLNSDFYNPSYCGLVITDLRLKDTGLHQFDAYTFTNTEITDQCVTVTLDSAYLINYGTITSSAYDSAGFVPSNPIANFVAFNGDAGFIQYTFNAPAGKKFTVVVYDPTVLPAYGVPYNLNVTYTNCAATPPCSPVAINPSIATGHTGITYKQVFSATGGSGAYDFSLSGNLPPGISFNRGKLTGTPTQAGRFPLTVTVADPLSCNLASTANDTLTIEGIAPDSIIAFAGTPQRVPVTSVFSQVLQAKVFGTDKKPLRGAKVFFATPNATGTGYPGGSFAGGLDTVIVVTDSLGIATAPVFTADSIAGGFVVTATVNSVAIPAFFELTNECLTNTLVTNSNDNGPGSLRFIISGACPSSVVTFAPGINKINLASGELPIVRPMTISGPGANQLTISGSNNSRIFTVNPAGAKDSINISGLTISDGLPQQSSNYYRGGGGILIDGGNVGIINCLVANNNASLSGSEAGGGIDNENATTVINNCSIVNNIATGSGGGIVNNGGIINIYNTTIAGNTSPNIYYTTFGGGVYLSYGTVNLTNCTVYGNSATVGGNMYASSAYSYNYSYDTLKNSIIAGGILAGTGFGTSNPDLYGTGYFSEGYNVIQDAVPGDYTITNGVAATDMVGINPGLLPLANYGGTTPTLLPLPSSPVINKGDISLTAAQFDQRGYARVAAGRADIGAVEANYADVANAGTPQSAAINTPFAAALQARVTENGNPVDSVPVVFSAPQAAIQSGTFANGQPTDTLFTSTAGVASAAITANNIEGIYNVTGNIAPLFAPAYFYLTNTKTLAVTFGHITAAVNNCTVQIVWQTVTGEAGETFAVERSTDGINFAPLYTVPGNGNGNSNALQAYSYNDATPAAGANYYRIKQTGTDGSVDYSPTIIAVNTCTTAPVIAYPNPAHNTLNVVMPANAKQTISIFDATGRLIKRYASVSGTLEIDVSRWAAGIYTLSLLNEDKASYHLKIIKN